MRSRSLFKILLLSSAMLIFGGFAQASEPSPPSGPTLTSSEPYQLAAAKIGQLDMGDERPVGEDKIMRGKKFNFGHRVYGRRNTDMLDLGILVTSLGLLGLIVYVFRRRTA